MLQISPGKQSCLRRSTSIFHSNPDARSLGAGVLLVVVAGSPYLRKAVLCWHLAGLSRLASSLLPSTTSASFEHLSPSKTTQSQCSVTSRQNVLEGGIDGSTEITGLLCTELLMEVSRAGKGVICCSDEGAKSSLWKLPDICLVDRLT